MNTLIQIFLALVLLAIAAFAWKYVFLQNKMIMHYKRQGVTILAGAYRPCVGNLYELNEYFKAAKESQEPLVTSAKWMFDTFIGSDKKKGPGCFKSEEHPCVLFNVFFPTLSINDPNMV